MKNKWLLILGIICVAATLRAPLTAVGPIINVLKEQLHINDAVAGILTTIPLIIFGLVSPFVSRVVDRLGMAQSVLYAVLLLICGLLIRVSGGLTMLLIGTILIGIAIAFGNVTLPSYVKWAFPLQIGLMTGIYSATMNLTAGFGAGASYPLYEMTSLGYKLSLGFWLLFAVLAVIIWLPQLNDKNEVKNVHSRMVLRKSTLAWAMALMMGFQSMMFYTTVAWIPSIMMDRGLDPKTAGLYLMLNQFVQVPMTFLFPIIAGKLKDQRVLIVLISLLFIIGFSLLFTDHMMLAMIFAGLAGGSAFSMCMLCFALRARTKEGSIALSGFGQSGGYFIAAIGPFLMGYLHETTNNWTVGIILLIVMALGFLASGLYAGSDRVIEDEL